MSILDFYGEIRKDAVLQMQSVYVTDGTLCSFKCWGPRGPQTKILNIKKFLINKKKFLSDST